MAQAKGKDILSSDLDIFGGGGSEDTSDTGGDSVGEDGNYDIFGWAAWESGEVPGEEVTETTEGEVIEAGDTAPDVTVPTDDTSTDTTQEGTDENLDIDIENLFSDLEAETKDNPELLQLVDSLRTEISTLTTERNILQKENATINEKLMSHVGENSNLGIYKWVISNLEANPKLMMLAKYLTNSESPAIKTKLVGVVTDMLYDLTGEDVSDLINRDQSSKILAVAWKGGSSASAPSSAPADDSEMSYDDSISKLF